LTDLHIEIYSLIFQNVFDNTQIDMSSIDKKFIISSRVKFDIRINLVPKKFKARLLAQGNRAGFADAASARTINI